MTVSEQNEILKNKDNLINYYRHLSEVHLCEVENLNEPLSKIMIAKGVVIEIESDLLSYLIKNKPNDKSNKQKERLDILHDMIKYFEKSASINFQMKIMLRKALVDLNKEKKDHEETKKTLQQTLDLLNEE